MNASELERLELVIDTAGVSRRIELLLPIGVRPRQLSVRTRECHRICVRQSEWRAHAFNTREDSFPASLV